MQIQRDCFWELYEIHRAVALMC